MISPDARGPGFVAPPACLPTSQDFKRCEFADCHGIGNHSIGLAQIEVNEHLHKEFSEELLNTTGRLASCGRPVQSVFVRSSAASRIVDGQRRSSPRTTIT